jgi:hypothetical protein
MAGTYIGISWYTTSGTMASHMSMEPPATRKAPLNRRNHPMATLMPSME